MLAGNSVMGLTLQNYWKKIMTFLDSLREGPGTHGSLPSLFPGWKTFPVSLRGFLITGLEDTFGKGSLQLSLTNISCYMEE